MELNWESKEASKGNFYVKIIAGLLVVAILAVSGWKLLNASSAANAADASSIATVEQQAKFVQDSSNSGNAPNIANSAVKILNGIQEVTLSWGRLNYVPEVIAVKKDMPVRITADTARLQGCFRSLTIPELGLRKNFNEKDNVLEFTPTKSGTFNFGCSMGMGRGTLIVE